MRALSSPLLARLSLVPITYKIPVPTWLPNMTIKMKSWVGMLDPAFLHGERELTFSIK